MFDKIDAIIAKVTTDITTLKYISDNDYDEITAYPAFVLANVHDFELEKISINGQIYNSRLKIHFFLFADIDMTSANFKTLAESVIKSIAGTTGFEYIRFLNLRLTDWQIGANKVRGLDSYVELLSREAWV